MKLLDKAYYKFRRDDLSWAKFIRNYNLYVSELNDNIRTLNFQCIHGYLYQNAVSSFYQVGFCYDQGRTSQAKEFEKYFHNFCNEIFKELKSGKPKS